MNEREEEKRRTEEKSIVYNNSIIYNITPNVNNHPTSHLNHPPEPDTNKTTPLETSLR